MPSSGTVVLTPAGSRAAKDGMMSPATRLLQPVSSRRRRVALLTPGFSSSETDWCIPALLDLVRALAEKDDVTVFTLRYPHRRSDYSVHGATVRPFGGAQTRGLRRMLLGSRALLSILRLARQRRFDVFHALWAHEPGFLAVAAGRLLRIPTVVSLLGGELVDLPDIDYGGQRSTVNRWLTRQALKSADRVTVGSPLLADLARSQVPPESFAVMPLGVDFERFHPRRGSVMPEPELIGEPKLLQVASLVPVKDQITLLRAFRGVTSVHPRAHLHLVGEGAQEHPLRALAAELAVTDKVTFHGAVPHEQLPYMYRQADLLVVSSRFESQGMVMLEALACGCRLAGTAVGLMPELVDPDHTCSPQDVPGLERAILRALAEQPDAERARRLAEPYELQATAGRWRAVYASVQGSVSWL